MTEQKTYDYKGTKLVKVPIKKGCEGCFFENKNCLDFQPNCTKGFDDNITNIIFSEVKNEPVNKID